MGTNPRTLVWYARWRDLSAKLAGAGIERVPRACALEAFYTVLDDTHKFGSETMAESAHQSLRRLLADEGGLP